MSGALHPAPVIRQGAPTRICAIFNPVAKGDKARRFRRQLDRLAPDCVFKPTTGPGTAQSLAAAAVREGFDTVVAVGGDGTVNEVLNGIAEVPDGFQRVALGVLPLGTANVFARELGIPFGIDAAWRIILSGALGLVDVIRVEFRCGSGTADRHCIQLAGAGLDARAVELVDWSLKKRAGFLAYIRAGLRALRESQPRLTAATSTHRAEGQLVLLGNGRLYGGPFVLFPQARLHDGQFEVRVFPRADWRTALGCAIGVLTRRPGMIGGTTDFRAARLTLTADRRVPLELDGEYVGDLPAHFELLPQALRVIVPA